MEALKHYESFNPRRYGDPWVAPVDPKTAKPDFTKKVGGYTGGYNRGEAGDLYLFEPVEGTVYTYGQKDYRGNKTERGYAKYTNGGFVAVTPETLLDALKTNEETG